MEVHTPISTTRTKNVHSPPSVGSNSPSSARNFKKFSGQVLTRVNSTFRSFSAPGAGSPSRFYHSVEDRPRIIQRNSSRFAPSETEDEEQEFGPSFLSLTKPTMNIGTRRSKAPAPLHLSPITPRPTPRKCHSSSTKVVPCLESPMDSRRSGYVSSDCASWVTASSIEPRRRLNSALEASPTSRFTVQQPIFRDPWPDMYPEDESPTCAAELRKNVSLLSGGPKNYATSNCSICNESLTCALDGEKLIELSCDHQCHYNCFLISFEALLPANAFPTCSICKKASKPKNEDALSELTAKILCGGSDYRAAKPTETASEKYSIQPQSIHQPIETGSRQNSRIHDLRTPFDQVIRSAEVTSDGFKHSCNLMVSPETRPTPSTRTSSFGSRSFMSKSEGPDYDLDLSKPRIHLVPQLSKFSIKEDSELASVQYVMATYLPKGGHVAETAKLLKKKETRIRNEVQAFVEEMLEGSSPMGLLETFDILSYSEDEDTWVTVTAFLFRAGLVLAADGSIVGNIPKNQISQLHQLDPNTIIMNLKSKSLPEVFLSCQDDSSVIRKWFYYLKQVYLRSEDQSNTIVPIGQLTSNSWELLPDTLAQPIRPKLTESEFGEASESRLSVVAPCGRLPLKVVLCFSIINCHPELHSNEEHLFTLKSTLLQCLKCLSSQDLIGLVVVGRDGAGRVGPFGTFIGMVRRDWDGLLDFVEGLTIRNNDGFFENDACELKVMLETCHKLICTIEQDEHISQLVILGNDHSINNMPSNNGLQMRKIKRSLDTIVSDFNFSIHQYFTCNSRVLLTDLVQDSYFNVISKGVKALKDVCANDLIARLHESFIKSFSACLRSVDSSVVQFCAVEHNGQLVKLTKPTSELRLTIGNLRPGEVKNVVLEVQVHVSNLRHHLGNYFLSCEAPSSLLQYAVEWYDHSGVLSSQGYSFCCDFKFSSSGTTVSSTYSMKAPFSLCSHDSQGSELESLNISLAPPMSASRDMFFSTRQMELLTAETLKSALSELNATASTILNQLVSIIYCISRDCICNDPRFYRLVKTERIGHYAEKLSLELQHIAQLSSSSDSKARALSRWKMREMRARLICQDR
ncbi:LAME_0G04588g1_1 [Lachancea meyersii CBS 8951]|uniref:LAME_0G04588g1_1 n=1 Tax=Lachancea meyersii CBS 8951 TaxID=1266667 RepID=A0A1G4K713_9SACH|nr:LAME_0G04588g1_1 [Lachancea meyersii CBS 8951]